MEIPDRLKGDPFWDKPTSMETLLAINATLPLDIKRSLVMTPWEMFEAGLIKIGTDGSIIMPAGTDSTYTITEANSAVISGNITEIESFQRSNSNQPTVGAAPTAGASIVYHKRFGATRVTLVGGALANVELVPALAGFNSVIQIHSIWSPTADVYNLVLQDEDDAGLVPDLDTGVNVEIKGNNEISPYATTHGAAGDNSGAPPTNPTFNTAAQNKAIEVDVVGAGVQVIIIFFCFWYEDLP